MNSLHRCGSSNWGGNANIGDIYLYTDDDKDRIGNVIRKPKSGDLCLCLERSGDCFYTYLVIRPSKDGYKKAFTFGAYQFGKGKSRKISKRKFHLLQAGETVKL